MKGPDLPGRRLRVKTPEYQFRPAGTETEDALDAAKDLAQELKDTGSVTHFPVSRPRSSLPEESLSNKRFCAHHRSAGHHDAADHVVPDEDNDSQVLFVSGWVPEAPLNWEILAAAAGRKARSELNERDLDLGQRAKVDVAKVTRDLRARG